MFRQGDPGQCWYAVLGGSVDVKLIQPDVDPKVSLFNIYNFSEELKNIYKNLYTSVKSFRI